MQSAGRNLQPTSRGFALELLYPYSPSTVLAAEGEVLGIHDNDITQGLAEIASRGEWRVRAVYLTDRRHGYQVQRGGLPVSFFPVSFQTRPSSKEYHKQWSAQYLSHLIWNAPDALGIFGSGGYFAQFASLLCRLRRIPYFIIAGDIGIPNRRLQQLFFRGAERVLVHTRWHRDMLVRDKGIDPRNLEVFPIGINTNEFAPKPLDSYFRQENWPRFIYVGRLTPSKGALASLHAFADIKPKYPQAQLEIIGPEGDKSFLERMHTFVQEQGLRDSVTFAGTVSHHDLPSHYARADLMIFPSVSESFGMVVVESMSCGTPVLARKASGGPDEIIDHGIDGLLLAPEEMAQAACGLFGDRDALARMGQAARSKVERCYSAAQTRDQLDGLLARLACRRQGRMLTNARTS